MMRTASHPPSPDAPKRPWITPVIRPAGAIGQILKAGSNKLTVVGDPAEPGKAPGPDL